MLQKNSKVIKEKINGLLTLLLSVKGHDLYLTCEGQKGAKFSACVEG